MGVITNGASKMATIVPKIAPLKAPTPPKPVRSGQQAWPKFQRDVGILPNERQPRITLRIAPAPKAPRRVM